MKEQILENIRSLYKSHIVTVILFLILMIITIAIVVGVIKFDIIKSSMGKIVLFITVIVCSVLLIVSQYILILPIYRDYRDSSYTIIDEATMVMRGDSSGVLDRTSTVFVKTQEVKYEFKMQTDLHLDVDVEYVGTVVFLKHSKYIVWYEVKEKTDDCPPEKTEDGSVS